MLDLFAGMDIAFTSDKEDVSMGKINHKLSERRLYES
jgi:hypothetical protein